MHLRKLAGALGACAAFGIITCGVFACGSSHSSGGGPSGPDGGGTDGPNGGDGGGADGPSPPPPPPPACPGLGPLTQKVATLAGCDTNGETDGAREVARFNNPTNVLVGPNGTAYVTDFDGNALRAVDTTGATTTLIRQANFSRPFGLALGPAGTIYVETDADDNGGHSTTTGTVWKVDPVAKTATVVARDIGRPRGLALLNDGRLAMADNSHHVIQILDPGNGQVTLLAGAADQAGHVNDTGGVARFSQPWDIVVLANGDLAVSDLGNHQLRRVTLAGVVTDLAGTGAAGNDDGAAIGQATFDTPKGLAVVGNTVYISDSVRKVVRKLDSNTVTTIAGDGTPGYQDSDTPLTAKFYGLEGIDADATRVVAADGNSGDDSNHHHVRLIHVP